MAAFLVSSCAVDPAPSSQPTSTSSSVPSAPASASPGSPTPGAPEPPTRESIVQVVADGLQLRSAAGTQASVVGGLERGAVARIESDPVEADGFVWYEVVDLDGNTGWVASGDDEDPWIATVADQPEGSARLRFEQACDVTGPLSLPPVTVMDDRRVVMGDYERGWRLWRLTDAGFDRLSEAVLESPYLQSSAEYELIVRPDAEPPGHGVCAYTFTVGTAAEPIVVRSIQWLGEEEVFFEPSPERRSLDGIAHGLNTLEESLGRDAWEADPFPYIAASFMASLGRLGGPVPAEQTRIDPRALPIGTALGDLEDPPPSGICGDLTIAEAFELARVLRDADGGLMALDNFSSAVYATDAGWFSLTLAPQAPDGYPACSDAGY
jgi:hypothetical protein